MGHPVASRILVLAVAFVCVPLICCSVGKTGEYASYAGADIEDAPQKGTGSEEVPTGSEEVPQTGVIDPDPTEIVAKALLCFNDKHIYKFCEESYRLTQSGILEVSPEYVDAYCDGPCLLETHLVLNCTEGILKNFKFHNAATIKDVRETIQAACGYGDERGNFNVTEHIGSEESSAYRITKQIITASAGFMIVGRAFWL